MITPKGELLRELLSARGDESETAELLRAHVRAQISAERICKELLVALAKNRRFPKNRFLIAKGVTEENVLKEGLVVDELIRLLGVNIIGAIDIEEQQAGENCWYKVFLLLPELKKCLGANTNPTSRRS